MWAFTLAHYIWSRITSTYSVKSVSVRPIKFFKLRSSSTEQQIHTRVLPQRAYFGATHDQSAGPTLLPGYSQTTDRTEGDTHTSHSLSRSSRYVQVKGKGYADTGYLHKIGGSSDGLVR